MAFNFPASPANGQTYSPAGGPSYIYNGTSGTWTVRTTGTSTAYVAKSGDTMSGHLTVPTGPAAANAVRKDYVDAADINRVAKSGDTMTGPLGLPAGTPTSTQAVRKDQMDAADANRVSKSGDWMSGPLQLDSASVGAESNLIGSKNGAMRWTVQVGSAHAQSGGNTGANFYIRRWSDAGGFLGDSMGINRDSGKIYFDNEVTSADSFRLTNGIKFGNVPSVANGGFTGDTTNVAMRIPNPAGRAYIQDAAGTANYVALGPTSTFSSVVDLNGGTNASNKLNAIGSVGTIAANINPVLEVQSAGPAHSAYMAFHRPGGFASLFGLDTDNQLKWGGWSHGAVAHQIYHQGNVPQSTAGYIKFLNQGVQLCWGLTGAGLETFIPFPVAFANVCMSVVLSHHGALPANQLHAAGAGNIGTTGFVLSPRYVDGGSVATSGSWFCYVAIGY